MNIKTDLLRAAGYTEDQIQQVQDYCDAAKRSGTFSRAPAVVNMGDEPHLVCQTIAEIMDQLRPGCWLPIPDSVIAAAITDPANPDRPKTPIRSRRRRKRMRNR